MGLSSDLEKDLNTHDLQLKDENVVAWKKNSTTHPRQWGLWSKGYTSVVVIWLEMYMTGISTAGTATAMPAAKEYSIEETLSIFCFVTVYLLGQTFGAIFLAPISELFGRRTIYIIGTGTFAAGSIVTAAPPHLAAAVIGRFFQGIAAAIPATVAFGNFADMFAADHRIWVVYAYTLFGLAGLALGPIYSSYIIAVLGWRWVYYISTIVSGVSLIACCFIKESNADRLLQARTDKIKKSTGNDSLKADVDDHEALTVKSFIQDHIVRPVRFLVSEPLVTLCAFLCAVAFSLLYAATESLTIIYTTPPFDQTFDMTSSSLAFIAILIGEILNILPRFYDVWLYKKIQRKRERIVPENKIHSFAVACPALAVGLWILAWTVPSGVTTVPWPISMIGLILIGFAANDFSYVLFGYVTDAYGFYAASAVSAVSISRTMAAGIFPLFVTQMYDGIGNNYAGTILAAVATLFCFTPWLFLKKGQMMREKSRWAAQGDDCLREENEYLNDDENNNEKKSTSTASSPSTSDVERQER